MLSLSTPNHCLISSNNVRRGYSGEKSDAASMSQVATPTITGRAASRYASLSQMVDSIGFLEKGAAHHPARVARYSRAIAEYLRLPPEECDLIDIAAFFHDIGKVAIPEMILSKPGRLTARESAVVTTHTRIGASILKGSYSKDLYRAAEVALLHHEKYDGTGYPFGLRGKNIPLSARIVAVADVYDALTSERSYKSAWPTQQALDYLDQQQGRHFDPVCVEAFFGSYFFWSGKLGMPAAQNFQSAVGLPAVA